MGPGGAIGTEPRDGTSDARRRTRGTARAKSPVTIELLRLCLLAGFLLAPVPLILSMLADARRAGSPPSSTSHLALSALVLWAIAEALPVTVLGLARRLSVADLAGLAGAVLVLGLARLLRRGRLAVVARALLDALDPLSARSMGERWLVAMSAGVLALLFVQEISLPTSDYDSLAYQLPRVVEWSHRGNILDRPDQWAGWINSYPFAWNTLFFVAMAPVQGDQWALVPNLVAWLIFGLAVYGLARHAGGDRSSALAAAVVALMLPVNLIVVHSAHNDLALAAFALASAYFALHAARERDGASALLSAAAAGMMLGSRMSGAGYLLLLAVLWAGLTAFAVPRGALREMGLAAARRPLLAGIAAASLAVLGASWYAANYRVTGNPLGFFEVSVLGHVLWKGSLTRAFVSQTDLWHNFRLADLDHWRILSRVLRQFVGVPGLLLGVGGVFALGAFVRRRRDRGGLGALLALAAISLFFYVAGPWTGKGHPADADITDWMGHQIRYSLPFWGFLAAAAGAAVPGSMYAVAGALAAIAAVQHSPLYTEFSHRRAALSFGLGAGLAWLSLAAVASHGGRGALERGRALAARRPGWVAAVALGVAVLVGIGASGAALATRERRQQVHESRFGGIGAFVARQLDPAARIGFWGSNQSYLLYGGDLRRRLSYLALDGERTAGDMIRYVRTQPVDVVAVGPRFGSSPVWDWLAEHPEAFERIHGRDVDEEIVVYRVVRDGS